MGVISLPNYDIGGVRLVCPGARGVVFAGLSTPTASPAPGKFGGHGFPPGVDVGRVGANGGLVGPLVGVEPLRGLKQPIAFLRGARTARDPMVEVRKPGAQYRGRSRAQGLAQQRLVHEFDRWRSGRRGPLAFTARRTIATALRPLSRTAVARIGSRGRHGLAEQADPIKRNIRMGML